MQSIEFMSGDNETVRGVWFEPSGNRKSPAIVFAHGLASTYAEFGDYPQKFSARGYTVLAIDFRGHGSSDGMRGLISETRWVEDLRHAVDFVSAQKNVDAQRIALFGHSLGGGAVICAAARDARVRAVVAGATVGRIRDELGGGEYLTYRVVDAVNRLQKIVTRKSLYIPYRVTYKDIFFDDQARARAEKQGFLQRQIPIDNVPLLLKQDALSGAQNLRVPALIIQSEKDAVVKATSTRKVFDAIPSDKEYYLIQGSGHSFATDCKSAEVFEKIAAWLDAKIKV
ncbi:MAG: alpha/beta fold hydrolase [Chloroflexi bacterium]|nr:alpha/beta fold hydrolase [Chloroflexota bacterium]